MSEDFSPELDPSMPLRWKRARRQVTNEQAKAILGYAGTAVIQCLGAPVSMKDLAFALLEARKGRSLNE